jgi:hypothetical protein
MKFNGDVKPLDDAQSRRRVLSTQFAMFYKTLKAPILWSDSWYVALGCNEALPWAVDGDCARGDDDSEAFAMRSEGRTSAQFLEVTHLLAKPDNVILHR